MIGAVTPTPHWSLSLRLLPRLHRFRLHHLLPYRNQRQDWFLSRMQCYPVFLLKLSMLRPPLLSGRMALTTVPCKYLMAVESTSWQEGVDGPGIGEKVYAQFDNSYYIEYLTFRLGNWKTNDYYTGNNRPKDSKDHIGK